jgi:hypothetical protein
VMFAPPLDFEPLYWAEEEEDGADQT